MPLRFIASHSARLSQTRSRTCAGHFVHRAILFAALLTVVVFTQALSAQSYPPSSLAAALQSADAALHSGNIALAEQRFQAVLRLDPHNGSSLANLGVIAYSRHDCAAAVGDLRAALDAAPQIIQARALLGICERRIDDTHASTDLRAAFDKLPDGKLRIEVGVNLADLFYQRGDMDATLPILQRLLALAPDNTDILFFAQRIYSEQADNALNKLLLLAPDSARMQQLIAEKLINTGDARDAIDHYKQALALDPNLPGMHFELAEAYLEQGNDTATLQLARQQLLLAQDSEGDNARVESALGTLDRKRGDFAHALEHLQRASQLSPNDPDIQLSLGSLLADQNKPQLAIPLLRAAVAADPMNAAAHYRLARVCHQLHLTDEETQQLKLYREVRKTQDRVATLYQQMNRSTQAQSAAPAADQPQ